MKLEKTFTLPGPVDKVMELVRDPSMIEQNEKSRDALEVKIQEVSKDDAKHVYKVETKNPFKTKTGGVDKKKTETNIVTNTWDLGAKKCTWTWEGDNPNAGKVSISGATVLAANGDNTDMTLIADVEVSIPVIGKTVSKKIAEAFGAEWPKYIDQIKAKL